MPIRPDLWHHYRGPEWQGIRRRILDRSAARFERAGDKCEWCGKPDKHTVLSTRLGSWCRDLTEGWFNNKGISVPEPLGQKYLLFCVVTVAHLNHVAGDNRDENLAALCQRCHLDHDREQHRISRQLTLRAQLNNLELEFTAES